jgi:SAM-dependent methyltransferase
MNLSRDVTQFVHFILDECVPPIIRDSRWFNWLPFSLLFRDQAGVFVGFKDAAYDMTVEEFRDAYRKTASVHLQRPTDLNDACTRAILAHTCGDRVLEVGCGRGYLAAQLAESNTVTACDMVIPDHLPYRFPAITFREEVAERLTFPDSAFDTVICTHTLEHVRDLSRAIAELRRVATRRLIVVVPKQRPFRHTFDLHLHFFPLRCMLLAWFQPDDRTSSSRLTVLGGDWYYVEDRRGPETGERKIDR